MADSKVKFYKNSEREKNEVYKKDLPQYKELGVEPTLYKSSLLSQNLPNFSKKNEVVDDLSEKIIDNNDFHYYEVANNAFKIKEPAKKNKEPELVLSSEDAPSSQHLDVIETLSALKADEYLLIVNKEILCSGPLEEIEEQAKILFFGENELYKDLSLDDILIIKRVKIKVGLFLEN